MRRRLCVRAFQTTECLYSGRYARNDDWSSGPYAFELQRAGSERIFRASS